jgi:hypothetical protein
MMTFRKMHFGLVDVGHWGLKGNTTIGRVWYAFVATIHGNSLLLMYRISGEVLT